MKIPVTLNGKKIIIDSDPSEKLLTVLRKEKLYSVKCGCNKGLCGNCMVLLDDKPVTSCTIPVGMIKDCKIVTLEYLKNYPEYNDITTGFTQAKINLCGYCNAAKYLIAYEIVKRKERPDIETLKNTIKYLDHCCTDTDTLINGILYSVAENHKRRGKKSNAKK